MIDIDLVRGLSLVVIFVFHCGIAHHRLVQLTHPFVFDAAIAFVSISGFLAGVVYSRRAATPGLLVRKVFARARTVWLTHVGLLIALALTLAMEDASGADGALQRFFGIPPTGEWNWLGFSIIMVHRPVLFDILPIYVVCLLVVPIMVLVGTVVRTGLLAISWLLWLATWWHGLTHTDVVSGEFSLLAWQAVFVTGCWVGLERDRLAALGLPGRYLTGVSWAVVLAGVMWVCLPYLASRSSGAFWIGVFAALDWQVQVPAKFDKTTLHPLIVVSWVCVVILWWRHRSWLVSAADTRLGDWLRMLGSHALPVFALGTLLCIGTVWLRIRGHIGQGPVEDGFTTRGMVVGQAVLLAGIACQFVLAWWLERNAQRMRS